MEKLIRLSVTTLERFRRFKDPAFDYITEENMVDTIKGVFTHSPAMSYGEDFGAFIEDPTQGKVLASGAVRMPGYKTYIAPAIVQKAMEYRDSLQSPTFETPVRATYKFTDMPDIIISGRMDIIEGRVERDIKTTHDFDFDSYYESLQWRFYLDMLGVDQFVYDVFELKGAMEDPNDPMIRVAEDCELHSFTLYGYPNLKKDCRNWIAELMGFIKRKDLMEYVLKEWDETENSPLVYDGLIY